MVKLCSVVVRTNGPENLAEIFESLTKQVSTFAIVDEVVVLDGRKEGDLSSIIDAFTDRIRISYSKYVGKKYRYGAAMNQAVTLCKNDIVLSLSGHSVPVCRNWIDAHVSALFSSKDIVAVCGSQIFGNRVNFVERAYRSVFYQCHSTAKLLKPFNLTNACFSRSRWIDLPFDEVLEACEDKHWTLSWNRSGYRTVFSAEAMVYHAHYVGVPQTIRELIWLSKWRLHVHALDIKSRLQGE